MKARLAYVDRYRIPRLGALPVLERNLLVYRRLWLTVLSGFFEPVFYLTLIGYGLGRLVPELTADGGQPVSYPVFVAPALLAVSAMNGAVFDSTQNFFWKLRFTGVYEGMLATSLGPAGVMFGEAAWALGRGAVYGVSFLGVSTALGLVRSPWALLALPGALLIGLTFAACGMAATTFVRNWRDTAYFPLALLPMFLLSTTFYPLSVLPAAIRPVVQVLPLYHGVALLRGLMLSGPTAGALVHVGYLLLLATGAMVLCIRRFTSIQSS